jgi:dimethylargininase
VQFTRAIVRPPGRSFAAGLSSAGEGPPALPGARTHAAYVQALRDRGIQVTQLQPDEAYPDGTFVEDTAIVSARGAILTRPGVPSRRAGIHRGVPAPFLC